MDNEIGHESCPRIKHNRFGVVIKISIFLAIFLAICSDAFAPYFLINCTDNPLESDNLMHSRCVCLANSRVGAIIKTRHPSLLAWPNSWIIGNKKAAVLPDPVGAHANNCRP